MPLPYELLLDCFDLATRHPLNILLSDYRCLRNLSLVSKQISIYAQQSLFHSVFLFKNRHALAFGSALNPGTEKGRWLASLVYTLKAQVRHERGGLTQQLFTAALLACPNLHELDLDVAQNGFDMSPFSTVFISRASPIQALRIAAPGTTSLEFLRVFPSLKFVEFKYAVAPGVPQGSAPACKLAELHWPGPVNDVLLWVLQSSVGILEVLGLPSAGRFSLFKEELFERLMSTHGLSLRSLHVPALPESQALSLRHCTQLQEFTIDGVLSEGLLCKLPRTIEHLQVQSTAIEREQVYNLLEYVHCFLPHLVHFIETAPSLLTFTWVHESTSTFKELQDICERRGVVWRGWTQPFGTYSGERQELGYVDTFPRKLSMSRSQARDLASDTNLEPA